MKWFRTQRREAAEEIEAHIAERIDELLESGLPPKEAAQKARREFGNQILLTESSRDVWGWIWLDRLGQDLRYALRMLWRSPGFTAVAVLSLALGIGANTAIFTLIEAALWRPIPVPHPERLRLLSWQGRDRYPGLEISSLSPRYGWYDDRSTPDGGTRHHSFTWPIYREFQRANTVFDALFAFKEIGRITAVVDGNAEPVNCFLVSGGFYRGMGVSPVIGRLIGPANEARTADGAVAVISYEYWTRRFGRSPSVIGKTIALNQAPVTIIGVNPAQFTGIEPGAAFEIWAPLGLPAAAFPRSRSPLDDPNWWLPVMGRLKNGISDAQAQSALDVILQRRIDVDFPGMKAVEQPRLLLESGARGMDFLTDHYGDPLLVLLSLSGSVLLIACANVANLLLAKSAARQREISLRLALGAGQWRIVRQLLTEGLLLACMAGVAGVIFGYWTRNGIPAMLATHWRPSPLEAAFDPRVLLFSIGITLLTGVLFSLAPIWQARRVEMNDALKDGSRGTLSLSKLRAGSLLVVLQVTLSLLLLVGAGLFVRTFTNLKATPVGFNPERVLLFALDPPRVRYPPDRVAVFLAEIQKLLTAIPGAESVTFSSEAMLSRSHLSNRVVLNGQKPELTQASIALKNEVGNRFFETMGIPVLYGRTFEERDGPDAPRAVVVNREFGRHFFRRENSVGQTFTEQGGKVPVRIVGVCADARFNQLRGPVRPTFYRYLPQTPHTGTVTFEVKIAGDEAGVVKQIRQIVRSLDSDLAITDVRAQTEQIEENLSQERLLASLGAAFGALALSLACIGIYGVMAYAVARRTNEIGIRVALGAEPGRVAWMVLRESLLLAAGGVAVGIPAALALSRFIQSFLYGLKPDDPSTIAAAVSAMAVAGAMAGYLPARRAARVDPMTALRHE